MYMSTLLFQSSSLKMEAGRPGPHGRSVLVGVAVVPGTGTGFVRRRLL